MSTHTKRPISLEFGAALVLCLAYIVWMLSLPCFPSADGPVHMYFVHIFAALLSHSNPTYEHFFRIRHILPPYSLYYYALLVFSKIVPMLLADRIIICVYFISFVFGFRYLARAIGPSADRMTLLSVLLLLNWPLGMGFVNFCLALSFSMWATGLWLRVQGTRNLAARIVFLVLVTATMLTHPVPLLLLLAVVATLLAVRFIQAARTAARVTIPAAGKADLLTLGLASLNLVYVKIFTRSNPLHQSADVAPSSYAADYLRRFVGYYGREHALGFVYGHRPDLLLYRLGLILTLTVPLVLAVTQWRSNRAARLSSFGNTFLWIGFAAFILLPLLPSQLNGSYYFADRLLLCVWLAFLLAASGYTPSTARPRTAWLWIIAALVCNACLLNGANSLVRPAARAIASLDAASITPPGKVGFLVEDPRPSTSNTAGEVSWGPYTWALTNLFRHSDAIMANPPWMNIPIIPIAPTTALPQTYIPAFEHEELPATLQDDLLASPPDLNTVLAVSDFFVVDEAGRQPRGPDPLLQRSASAGWTCTDQSWYRVCSRQPVQFHP